jgi:predicted Ser/Thr protein kinase
MEKPPERVGPYHVEALLDRGGMSNLYLATDPQTGESVVLKVLQNKFLDRPDVVEHFKHECELLSYIDHPGIVRAIDDGQWEGGYFLALEFIQGISLRKWIQQTPVSLPRALEVILEIAEAVCHLHTHGIIHRDLKPENLLLTEDGRVKLIDLGIARKIDEDEPVELVPTFIGTPSYISPEQRSDPHHVSFPSDIYSLGIIAYELVLGRLCHGHVHLSLMPKGLQKILGKALQPDPKLRYSDLVDFITDLAAYQTQVLEAPSKEGLSPLPLALEGLDRGLEDLSPKSFPTLTHFKVFWLNQRGVIPTPFVFDVTEDKEEVTLFYGESGSFGSRGIVEVAYLKGLEHATIGSLEEKGRALKAIVENDPNAPLYKVAYLAIKENSFTFLAFGTPTLVRYREGKLERFGGEAPALGVVTLDELPLMQGEWKKGDFLLLDPTGLLPTFAEKLPPYQGDVKKWLQLLDARLKALSPSRLEGRSSFLILFTH